MKQKRINFLLLCFRILFTGALLYTVYFIFHNSMQIAAVSSARSVSVMNRINAFLEPLGIGPLSELVVRKLAHFAEYGMLGFFSMLCLRVYTRCFIRHISWPMFFDLLIAVTDETIQLFYTGRSSRITDVWIDFAGSSCGIAAGLLLLLIFWVFFSILRQKKDES